jgi:hypothetical protein
VAGDMFEANGGFVVRHRDRCGPTAYYAGELFKISSCAE